MKLMKLLFLFLLITIFFNTILFAAYVRHHPITLKQPDGTELRLFASGDEFYNWVHDKDGYTIVRDKAGLYVYAQQAGTDYVPSSLIVGRDNPATRGIQPFVNKSAEEIGQIRKLGNQMMTSHGEGKAPHTGTLNNLAIFIRFQDQAEFTDNFSIYSSMFNGLTGNNMQTYFNEASYNQLNIFTSFYPPQSAIVISWQDSHPRAYYSPYDADLNPIGYQGGNNGEERQLREHTLLANAVIAVRSAIPPTLNIDGDGDGNVDNVCFIIEGDSDGWAELLWPHRWSLNSQEVFINGKRVYDFNFQLSEFMADRGVGVLCHEMFHSLGSPDLYHYTDNGIAPVGGWDLMEGDQNPPQHMSAFMKFKYGLWISNIPVIDSPGTFTLNTLVNPTNNCYRINTANSSTQYYVLEYRKKIGTFESSLPGSGLLIYRINTEATGNAQGPPDEVYAYRVNGTTTTNGDDYKANFSDEEGRISFNQYTNPSPFLSSGTNGLLALSNIGSTAGNEISFTYNTQSTLPTAIENFETGFTSLPWTFGGNAVWSVSTAQHYNGLKSAKAGVIGNNQTTSMTANITSAAGQVSFFYRISSETNWDNLKFYIDGVYKNQWSGEGNWAMVSFNITAGNHLLKWEYAKNSSIIGGSDGAWVDYISYPPAFNPPTNFTATAQNTSALLAWNSPTGAGPAGYKIYRDGTLLQTITNPATHQYTDTTVIPGTYTYKIMCYYTTPIGESAFTNEISVTIQPYVFNPPLSLTASPDNAAIHINWLAPSVSEGYTLNGFRIYRDGTVLDSLVSSQLFYSDFTTQYDQAYTYYIIALYVNPSGESVPSNSVTVTSIIGSFNPPTDLIAEQTSGNEITLHWQLPAEVLMDKTADSKSSIPNRSIYGVKLYRNGTLYQTHPNGVSDSYIDTPVTSGTYTYQVSCLYMNPNGESTLSNEASITIAPILTPPSNLTATIFTGHNVHLTWSVQAGSDDDRKTDIPNRSLIGFKIFLNNILHMEIQTVIFEYDIMDLPDGTYTIGVVAVYTDGESAPTTITIVGNEDTIVPDMQNTTALLGNYPNPFNPETVISFRVNTNANVSLCIYNLMGQKVRTLVNSDVNAGEHSVTWNGTDDQGTAVASGTYFYTLNTGMYTSTKKMVLLK